jgi:hypothetical protein
MTTSNEPRPTADKAKVQALIAELDALEAADRTSFAERLADNIMDPLLEETVAFRSEELAFKSFAAARYLVDNANEVLRRRRRGSAQQRGTREFLLKVGHERRILENIVNGMRAQRGQLPNTPNPRRRAMMELWNMVLRGEEVNQQTPRLLFEAEKAKDVERKKQERKARRASRNGNGR